MTGYVRETKFDEQMSLDLEIADVATVLQTIQEIKSHVKRVDVATLQ